MDELTLKTVGSRDIWFQIDSDGDLGIEVENDKYSTERLYIRAADLPKLRDWLNSTLSATAKAP